MSEKHFGNITTDLPVIGFTGALGSGCSFLARGLERYHGYLYCSLSGPIHEELDRQKLPHTSAHLQDFGNKLRDEHGPDCLVSMALSSVNEALDARRDNRPKGIVIDGIRNTAEVEALRSFPHFCLISVQADRSLREARVLSMKARCASAADFVEADRRDAEEGRANGQQVRRCNYLSDIILINEQQISPLNPIQYQNYVHDAVYAPYVIRVEHAASGRPILGNRASQMEALMTAAYVISKRSACLKRKVGAIVADQHGMIIAAGANDVPQGEIPCAEHPRFMGCARDWLQEQVGQQFKYCPICAEPIVVTTKCIACQKVESGFRKRCTNPDCQAELDIDYKCKCGTEVFKELVPGGSQATGKLLDMCRSLHAEENAIVNLAKSGVRIPEYCILFSTTFPCNLCANKIVNAGIREVVYAEPYTMKEAEDLLRNKGIKLTRFQGVKSNAYFRVYQ